MDIIKDQERAGICSTQGSKMILPFSSASTPSLVLKKDPGKTGGGKMNKSLILLKAMGRAGGQETVPYVNSH